MAASGARFMEKLPVFVRGLYGTTARRTGDLQKFSLNECVNDVFYELSCRIPQELWFWFSTLLREVFPHLLFLLSPKTNT